MTDEIDIAGDRKATVGDLTAAIELGQKLIKLIAEEAELELKLKVKGEEIHQLESQQIPEAMESCGAEQLPLLNGGHIEIKDIVKASLPSLSSIEKAKDPDKKAALETRLRDGLEWLREHDGEVLIKNFLSFEFDKGQDNIVGELEATADELGISHLRETTVHPSTLEKYIKEKLEKGIKVPLETFGVYCGRKAVIIIPKKKSKSK